MRKWLVAVAIAGLPTLALASPSHRHGGHVLAHGGYTHAFNRYFDHNFRHARFDRGFRYGRFFFGGPIFADNCWRLVDTPYGLHRVLVCDDY